MARNEQFAEGSANHELYYGQAPEEVPNDNGYGTKTEHPAILCQHCDARFFGLNKLGEHVDFRHSESPSRQSLNDEWHNDYRGPSER